MTKELNPNAKLGMMRAKAAEIADAVQEILSGGDAKRSSNNDRWLTRASSGLNQSQLRTLLLAMEPQIFLRS